MKKSRIFLSVILLTFSFSVFSQVENAGVVRKRSEKEKKEEDKAIKGVTERMKSSMQSQDTHDADLSYMKEVYRNLDLQKGSNAALYYPEDVINGKENLFRILFKLVMDGSVPAYEYLDGREIFTDQYKVKIGDIPERFGIYAQKDKSSTDNNPKFIVEEADVPAGQVYNYYIIEKWEFDRRSSTMKTSVEAICPVLSNYGDYGGETKYPMFWIKYADIRPYLENQFVFVDDDNNVPQYSIDDFFTMGIYNGEIYKTRNLRNLSMAQMYPDEDDLKRAQDSIDNHLKNYGKNLWVPSREEYLAMKEAENGGKGKKGKAAAAEAEELPVRADNASEATPTVVDSQEEDTVEVPAASSARAKKKSSAKKVKKPKVQGSSSTGNTSAEKSVRRRKR